jgi:hypothetical protein
MSTPLSPRQPATVRYVHSVPPNGHRIAEPRKTILGVEIQRHSLILNLE